MHLDADTENENFESASTPSGRRPGGVLFNLLRMGRLHASSVTGRWAFSGLDGDMYLLSVYASGALGGTQVDVFLIQNKQ